MRPAMDAPRRPEKVLAPLLVALLAFAAAGQQGFDEFGLPVPEDDPAVEAIDRQLDAADERFAALLAEGDAADGEPAAGALPLDLAAAVDTALANNPALAAVEARRGEVEAAVREVRADALPQVAAVSSYSISRNPAFLNSPDFEDLLDQFPEGSFEPQEQRLYGFGVEVTQPVYTFGKLSAAIDLARLLVDANAAQIEAARLDTALAAAEAYYDLLAARDALAVTLVERRVRREALEVVRTRYEVGEATRLEMLRAQSALAAVLPDAAERAGDLAVAESRLRHLLGLPPGTRLAVAGGLVPRLPAPEAVNDGEVNDAEVNDEEVNGAGVDDAAPGAAFAARPAPRRGGELPPVPPFDAVWAAARGERPEIADLELQAAALTQRQVVTRAEGRPQIELNGFYGREARLFSDLGDRLFDNYAFALGLRWEFFDGGRRKGQIAQFESQRRQLGYRLADLLAAIRLDVEEALTAYRTARERWWAAETAAAAAAEASRVARESYREGVALQTDWLDAQRQQAEAENLALEAYYEARTEAARLARAVGALPTRGWSAAGAEAEE